MPRIARIYSKQIKVYHVIIRGCDQQDVWLTSEDKQQFLKEINKTKEKYWYDLYAYCIMDNHVHLLLYDAQNQISTIMKSLQIRYANYFNKKYSRIGSLFQNRFFSRIVEDQRYLLQVCRYIHQNPSKAGMAEMEQYQWSSYQEYIGSSHLAKTDLVLKLFSDKKKIAQQRFIEFHKKQLREEKSYELVEFEMKEKLTDEEVKDCICGLFGNQNWSQIFHKKGEQRQKELQKLKQIKGTSMRQLSRILGVNRKIIERAFKDKMSQKETSPMGH